MKRLRKIRLLLLKQYHPNWMCRFRAADELLGMAQVYLLPVWMYKLMYKTAMYGLAYTALNEPCSWIIHKIPFNIRFNLA